MDRKKAKVFKSCLVKSLIKWVKTNDCLFEVKKFKYQQVMYEFKK